MNSRCVAIVGAALISLTVAGAEFPEIYNSEPSREEVLAPGAALEAWRVPAGFQVTLFAAEPEVRQPIAMAFDARGRLWVAENYTYAERGVQFDRSLRDRILIFEDTDQDGQFDRRKVFWDEGRVLTSIEIGFGGVWALCAPHLLFIPDRNQDDIPDGEPEVLLEGWNAHAVQHNVVNGLKWGPDGWLYGRHGILASSHVGKPGSTPNQRQEVNCGIWRYHPTRKTFEVIANGTTNPWGMDWNEDGEPFFINTVIGHLWHLIPGAHYRRMYGEDPDPQVYLLIDQHADHYHWDRREVWSDVRNLGVTKTSSQAGGGHAHAGFMIYLGDNWPAAYRGRAFTINFHGRRLNQDRLERRGSGYVGRHEPDQFFSNDPWFRGVELAYGPDGGVYVADWSDTGECHEQDGVHRSSGRLFKVTYGKPARVLIRPPETEDEFVRWLTHPNDWFARQARLRLQERSAAGVEVASLAQRLHRVFKEETSANRQVRMLWAIQAAGAADSDWLREQLQHTNEFVRTWAIRYLVDSLPLGNFQTHLDEAVVLDLIRLASVDPAQSVRLTLASALQRLPLSQRTRLAGPLLARGSDAADHNLPLMLWYGVKPIAEHLPMAALQLLDECEISIVRRLMARRVGEELERAPHAVNALLRRANQTDAERVDVVDGLAEAWRGWRSAQKPDAWDEFAAASMASSDRELQRRVRDLNAFFGDGRALDQIRQVALDPQAEIVTRRSALETLIQQRAPDLRDICEKLLGIRELAATAARGLTLFDDPAIGRLLVRRYDTFAPQQRQAVIDALVSRPTFARELLLAIGSGENRIPPQAVSAFHARQIRSFDDRELTQKLAEVWGALRNSDAAKRETITRLKTELTPARLRQADLAKGGELFNQACASCHKLYGTGGDIGPDLTGSGRHNLDYLLENIVDPSAILAANYRISSVTLKDGRALTGMVGRQTQRALSLQTAAENLTLAREDIENVRLSTLSLMPDGLLESLTSEQVRDLIAYLMAESPNP